MEVYRHSGRITLAGIPTTVALGAGAAILLGVAYTYGIVYIRFIYVNVLLTLGFGYGLGTAVGWGAKLGKVRSPLFAATYGVIFALIGMYVAWGADIWARHGKTDWGFAVFEPNVLIQYIQFFYENGAWTIGHGAGAGKNAQNVSGVFLGLVWLVEAGMVVVTAAYTGHRFIASRPFCEPCNCWTSHERDVRRLSPTGGEAGAMQRLLGGDLEALMSLNRAGARDVNYLRLDLCCCPACQETNFLSIQSVEQTKDKKGKVQTKTSPLVEHMVIDPDDVALVREAGREPPAPDILPPESDPQPDAE